MRNTQLFFIILQKLKTNAKNLINMKKILLSLLCLTLFSGVFAQSFSLTFADGTAISPGATIQFLGDPTDDVIQAAVYVKNNSNAAKDVKVKKVINDGDTLTWTVNTFCWGLCYPPTTYVSISLNIQPGAICDQFQGDYNPTNVPGISKIMYVFFDENNINDSVAVVVNYNASPASAGDELVNLVKFSDAYPNPAISLVNVDYTVPEMVSKATITITNLLGNKVKEFNLDNRSGKIQIPVYDLVNGFYFYSLLADDQLLITRKFIVRH